MYKMGVSKELMRGLNKIQPHGPCPKGHDEASNLLTWYDVLKWSSFMVATFYHKCSLRSLFVKNRQTESC